MHVSITRLLIALGVTGAIRLATLYLRRLDAREANEPPAERHAIAASRRRAQGHLWLLGVLMSSIAIFALLFGANRPPITMSSLLGVSALAIADALCLHKMLSTYGEARRMHSS